ncbi:MAG: biopolymer transporter ExbD [Bdellovibrionales bacterium]|nr:biopolymer transporter ExbD [Bdellovibrionales bacterium]
MRRIIRENKENTKSTLQGTSVLKSRSGKKGAASATLTLTSLVDVFTIFVIYLLINTSADSSMLDTDEKIKLPSATQATQVESGILVKVIDNKFVIDEKSYSEKYLSRVLTQKISEMKQEKGEDTPAELIIQADKKSDFKSINPLMLVGSEVGFSKIKLAAISELESE